MSAPGNREALPILGAPGSPYTRKMIALLRYRRIPHSVLWGGHQNPPEGYPKPKVGLLPTVYFPDGRGGLEAQVDSTPILRRLEKAHEARPAVPADPVLSFVNYLIEDYADEWLTKAMFHYRWAHAADIANAGPMLAFWSNPTLPDDVAEKAIAAFTKRQIDRLYVVGSNATTAETIESSYIRLLTILNDLIRKNGYVLGARPASADFALYGQLTQLGIVEPTSAKELSSRTPRVRAWLDRVEDLSGLEPQDSDWLEASDLKAELGPLLSEIGRVYVPFLLANAEAVAAAQDSFETEIDGRAWTQPTFPYQAKCLAWIREEFGRLDDPSAERVRSIIAGTGCEALIG